MVEHVLADLFYQDGIDKQWEITAVKDGETVAVIDNDILTDRGITLNEALNDNEELKFGSFAAAKFDFEVHNVMSSLMDCELTVKVYLGNDRDNPFPIGVYKVNSDKPTADRKTRNISACDDLERVINSNMTDWYESLLPTDKSTTTMKRMRDSFCEHLKIEQLPISLVNDNFTITKTLKLVDNEGNKAVLSGRDVLRSICEANGCFCRIGRTGKLEYVYLPTPIQGLYPNMPDDLERYPNADLYPKSVNTTPLTKSMYIAPCDYSDFVTEAISKVEIRNQDGSTLIWEGKDGNTYLIRDNFIFYGRGSADIRDAAKNVLAKIKDVRYRPFNTAAIGNPVFECGDAVRLSTTYCLIETYILKRTLKGGKHILDTYESDGVEKYEFDVNNTNIKMVEQLNGIRRELTVSAEELTSKIIDETHKRESSIEQLSGEVGIRVVNGDIISNLSVNENGLGFYGNRIVISTDNFKINANGDVEIKGSLKAGSTITGATITGGEIETVDVGTGFDLKMWTGIIIGNCLSQGKGFQLDPTHMAFRQWNPSTDLIYPAATVEIAPGSITIGGKKVLVEDSTVSFATSAGTADTARKADSATTAGTADVATVAKGVTNHSVSSRDGLTASNGYEVSGDLIYIGGNWRAVSLSYFNSNSGGTSSDRKLKQNIVDVDEKYIDILDKLNLRNFQFKAKPDKTRCGLIAQEVMLILEDIGIYDSDIVKTNVNDAGEESLGVDYVQLLTLLIPAYQNLRREHDELVQTLKDKGVI